MKKLLVALFVLGLFLTNSASLRAGGDMEPAYCPVKAMEKAEQLKLSDAQKKQLEQIKEEGMKSFLALKEKVAADTKAVMTAKQVKKYDELKAKSSSESKHHKCDKCDKKEKCDKCKKKENCDGKSCERPDGKKEEK